MGLINDLMAKLPGVEGGQIKVEPVEDLGDGSTEKGNKQKATPVIYTPAAHHASYVNALTLAVLTQRLRSILSLDPH